MKIYHKTSFWTNVRNSFVMLTGPTTVGLHEFGAADGWIMASGIIGMLGGLLGIWLVDHDNNGVVDLFEEPKP